MGNEGNFNSNRFALFGTWNSDGERQAENFVVGSASPDNELRNIFDTKKLCRIFGIYLIFVAIFTALLGFFFNREFFTAYFICVLAGAFICIAAVVLTCRKKSE